VVNAFVVVAEGHELCDDLATTIQRFVRGRLSAYAYPLRIEFVDDLPRTPTGKIPGSSRASARSTRPARADTATGVWRLMQRVVPLRTGGRPGSPRLSLSALP
jgi:hypothetical protein